MILQKIAKKRVSFAEDGTNNCKDEYDIVEPITISFATKEDKIHQQGNFDFRIFCSDY